MPVTFETTHHAPVPAPWRGEFQEIITLAIDVSRPRREEWSVLMREMTDPPVVRLYFGRDREVPWSLTFLPESDDRAHSVLYRLVCYFLRRMPGGIVPS